MLELSINLFANLRIVVFVVLLDTKVMSRSFVMFLLSPQVTRHWIRLVVSGVSGADLCLIYGVVVGNVILSPRKT